MGDATTRRNLLPSGAIVHPCVVQVLDVGRQGDVFYLVMEYVRGTDLRSIARSVHGAKLLLAMALYVVGEVLRGVVEKTFLRGQIVYDGGEFAEPRGQLLLRKTGG